MGRLMRCLILICLFVLSWNRGVAQTEFVPSMTYDELIAKQNDYAGKQVRVLGNWFTFFEVNALYAASAKNRENAAWVEFRDDDELCKGSKGKMKKKYTEAKSVVFVGKLYIGGHFGHENGYNYKFVVDCVEQIRKISPTKSNK